MKILLFSSLWAPEEGTAQRRWSDLATILTDAGHTVYVVTAPPHYPGGRLLSNDPAHQPGARTQTRAGLWVYRTNFREHDQRLLSRIADQLVQLASACRIGNQLAKRVRPNIVIATAPPLDAQFAGCFISLVNRIPFVLDLRDVWPEMLGYLLDGQVSNDRSSVARLALSGISALARPMCQWCIDRADGVIVTTDSFRHRLLTRRKGKPTLTVRNLSSVRPNSPRQARREAGAPLHLLYAGTVGRAQGLVSSLRAVAIARANGADIRTRIVGSGAHLKPLQRLAKELDIPVTFTGKIPFRAVREHYAWCHTELIQLRNWLPLRWTVPSKLYDALSASRHITLIAEGESADLVRTLAAGDVVAPDDPVALAELLQRLWKDPQHATMADDGHDWVVEHLDEYRRGGQFVRFLTAVAKRQGR